MVIFRKKTLKAPPPNVLNSLNDKLLASVSSFYFNLIAAIINSPL